ncbi:hypothetical protein [Pseudoroseicyclus tamaricis]|uniref:Transferrin-binding protein B C-lobe/N-lobe beta barrel domain-containing protein n=1 Tax=Pseudoroseicyclus tamaricis TaxID=2705421 RepID=A0A6B2K3H9_9RHOB|nr:hypothetical protein [Pseudoroseicyclus tamaricis]NDV01126.1 hypothetical protein [Pseudoroseicyclus tamaricis]
MPILTARLALVPAALALLGACSSSSSDPLPPAAPDTPPAPVTPVESSIDLGPRPSLMSLKQEAAELDRRVSLADPTTTLPDSGTARYDGAMTIGDGDGLALIGNLALVADLEASELSGVAGQFYTEDGGQLAGRLDIAPTDISLDARRGYFDTGMTGDLSLDDTVYGIDATLYGEFYTYGQDHIAAGDLAGNLTTGGAATPITGSFWAH